MGPPCSSFVMLNAVNCKRKHSNNYNCDEAYLPVCLGNLLATAAALLMTVGSVRQVQVVVENPPASMIWKFPDLRQVLDASFSVLWSLHGAHGRELLGSRMLKYFKFLSTGSWISAIQRHCPCPGHRHFKLTWAAWRHGRRTFTGKRAALRQSAAYPDALGRAIVHAWRNAHPPQVVSGSSSWLAPSPGSRNTIACKIRTETTGFQRSIQGSIWLHSSSSWTYWMEPGPGVSASCSWLTPSAGTSPHPTSAQTDSFSTQSWMNPSTSSEGRRTQRT
jgi:hypothetical protein